MIIIAKELNDQYFTKKEVAELCWKELERVFNIANFDLFIEPSVGAGSFIRNDLNWKAYDIDISNIKNENIEIIEADFLTIEEDLKNKSIIIGNPPFGKRAKMAIEFINKAIKISNIVAFILPNQFDKYLTQKQLNENIAIISVTELPENSFTNVKGKEFKHLRTKFYIMVNKNVYPDFNDLRLLSPLPVKHNDFEMYQYNRTKEAEKYFDYDWDFAVLRQGYGDYSVKYYKHQKLDKKKQYIFFKAKNEQVLNKLKLIDFVELSKRNTSTPGFGKADVIDFYNKFLGTI